VKFPEASLKPTWLHLDEWDSKEMAKVMQHCALLRSMSTKEGAPIRPVDKGEKVITELIKSQSGL